MSTAAEETTAIIIDTTIIAMLMSNFLVREKQSMLKGKRMDLEIIL